MTKEEILYATTHMYLDDEGDDAPVWESKHIYEAMESYASLLAKEEAIQFAEWAGDNDWMYIRDGVWLGSFLPKIKKTSEELYTLFQQSKKQISDAT